MASATCNAISRQWALGLIDKATGVSIRLRKTYTKWVSEKEINTKKKDKKVGV